MNGVDMIFDKQSTQEILFENGGYIISSLIKILKWEDIENFKSNIKAVDKRLYMICFPLLSTPICYNYNAPIPTHIYDNLLSLDYLCVRSIFDSVVEKIAIQYTNNLLLVDNDTLYITIDEIVQRLSIDLSDGTFKTIIDYLPNSKGCKHE